MNDRRAWEGVVGAFILILSLFVAGCANFGTGGTGELVIPRERLRTIQTTDLAPIAAPAPTTQITTTQPADPDDPPPAQLPLTIEEVRRLALQNNLDLRVELIEPTIARTFISEQQAQFESLLVADASYAKLDSPTATQLTGSKVEAINANVGLIVPLQTGGTIRLNVPVERFSTNNQFSILNPAYTSDFSASISQPLLRGAGFRTNSHGIRIAFYDYQMSEARTKLQIMRVLAAADRVYWRLFAARQELGVRRQEYDLAVAQLDRARRLVRAGAAAEVEIIRAESGVADRLEAIIIAENQLRDRQRELKRLINEAGLEMGTRTEILIATPPIATPYRVDPDRAVEFALQHRMEMLELELRIAREASSVTFARNGMLPLVLLDYTYNVNGLGDTWGSAFDLLVDKDFEDHRLGLRVEVPIGNEAARARLRRALSSRVQALATQDLRAQLITQEVLNAIDQLEANWQRILAAQQRAILAARVLDVENRQFELGLRTSTEVLDAQTRLADAQSAEIAAITEYQIAQVDIAFAVGMLLGATNVTWDAIPAPR